MHRETHALQPNPFALFSAGCMETSGKVWIAADGSAFHDDPLGVHMRNRINPD